MTLLCLPYKCNCFGWFILNVVCYAALSVVSLLCMCNVILCHLWKFGYIVGHSSKRRVSIRVILLLYFGTIYFILANFISGCCPSTRTMHVAGGPAASSNHALGLTL